MFRRRGVCGSVVEGEDEMCEMKAERDWKAREGDIDVQNRKLLHYMELPDWMKDNEFIHGKYRPVMGRIRDCFSTGFFTWHNESVNIWSHFLGFVFFLLLTIYMVVYLTNVNGHFSQLFASAMEKCAE